MTNQYLTDIASSAAVGLLGQKMYFLIDTQRKNERDAFFLHWHTIHLKFILREYPLKVNAHGNKTP